MEHGDSIVGKHIQAILERLKNGKTLFRMKLMGKNFEQLSVINDIRKKGKQLFLLIDCPDGFDELVKITSGRLQFEYSGANKLPYYFYADIAQIDQKIIWVTIPDLIERRQLRRDFRVDMPTGAHMGFKKYGVRFNKQVINLSLGCVRAGTFAIRFPTDVSELLSERGVEVDPSCIWRWVMIYAPDLNKRCRPYLKPTNKSYRIDETYIKVKGQDKYLYRALDSTGQTIEFLLTAKRDKQAAKRFLVKAIEASGNPMPRVINVDKNPAYPAAVEVLKADGVIPRRVRLRQCKYLNNVIEQDHRTVKKRVWLAKGYGSFQSAWRTLQGIETVNMIRKGRVKWLPKEDAVGHAIFISVLFGLAVI